MSTSNIEKGLDEIIASTGISAGGRKSRTGAARGFKRGRAATSTKALGKALAASKSAKNAGKPIDKPAKGAKPANKAAALAISALNPLASAKRAVVSNMPLDINEDAVRQYFSANVGKVRKVEGNYREDGRPTGTYTITFEKPGKAQQLLEKFHGQPVDGGKSHMTVQILLDATAATPNTLQGRIGVSAAPTSGNTGESSKTRRARTKKSAAAAAPVKAVQSAGKSKADAKKTAKKTKAKANTKAKPKPKPRTAADLDAEMSDYFAKADQNEISV